MEKYYQLKQFFNVKQFGNKLFIGSLPPNALEIDDPPDFLKRVLSYFSSPRSLDEAKLYLQKDIGLSDKETNSLIDDLLDNKIIDTHIVDLTRRYSRHQLYYDLIGSSEPENTQELLAGKTVGMIGVGGIGTNVAMNLIGAGIGTLVFSDGDFVEESNLTRQFLYDETSIGEKKVDEAFKRLKAMNSKTKLVPVESYAKKDLFDDYFSECDFIVLSADSPAEIHTWINDAAFKYNFAYCNAGYIESFGVVGPLIIPNKTACFECIKFEGDLYRYTDKLEDINENLNLGYQTASYGPLNSLVASIQANEVIRYFLGLHLKSSGCRLLIDSSNYKIYEESFMQNRDCIKCSVYTSEKINSEMTLPQIYAKERTNDSFNALLLDDLMEKLVKIIPKTNLLDIGCGSGEQSLLFAEKGADVISVDISEEMILHLKKKIPQNLSGSITTKVSDIENLYIDEKMDYILCNNILDYLEDINPVVHKLRTFLSENGTLIVTIPHPIKDSGSWRKEYYNAKWNYEEFLLMNNYFNEGPVTKSREDKDGNTVISSITTYHRTTETYFNAFVKAGFCVASLLEPSAPPSSKETHQILFEKARIPYFQVFVLQLGEK